VQVKLPTVSLHVALSWHVCTSASAHSLIDVQLVPVAPPPL
jgi:hypothetical protein